MINSSQSIEEQLWEYIDGTLPSEKRPVIDRLVEEDAAWKSVYWELLEVHHMLQSSELEQPSLRFTKNVMEKIPSHHILPAAKKYINKKIIWAIGTFFITLIAGFLIYGLSQVHWDSTTKTNFFFDFSKIDFSRFFSSTYTYVFMMMIVVLGMMMLDNILRNNKTKLRHKN